MRIRDVGVFWFLLLTSVHCWAQLGTEGSILGNVLDTSGGAVSGASVKVTNTDTGLTKTASTNGNGYFQVVALPPGIYSVEAAGNGFATWQVAGLTLTAGEQMRIQPELKVGDVKQQVTVQAESQMVQTERASVETSIEQKQIRDLPLNGRIAVQLVELTPGMLFLGIGASANGTSSANVDGAAVEGMGTHTDATQFLVDGMSANDPSTQTGMAFPNLEAIDQFRVQTSSFSAENGRDPIQVTMITKSGTNQYHGTLWEFLRNDVLDARNTFSATKPTLRRNQWGASGGGPVIKNKTFFFAAFEGLNIRTQSLYNSPTINPAFLNGDFSSGDGLTITDPTTAKAFPGNQIPVSRFSPASQYFFKYILLPNSPGNLFKALAGNPEDENNFTLRMDQTISSKQRFYARWIRVGDNLTTTGYEPSVPSTTALTQHNAAMNYDNSITPWMLFNVSLGFVHSNYAGTSPLIGKDNLTADAGIQGFPTALRADSIGLPSVTFTGYAGFSWPAQLPSSFKREVLNGRTGLNIIRGKHTLVIGGEYLDERTDVHHSSTNPRGAFTFNGQYTGNGFADYLLGLVQTAAANTDLAVFGVAHAPYSAMYVDETWRVLPNLTLNAGIRWDYWWDKAFVRGAGTTFDLATGQSVAGENPSGQVDLTAQPVAPFFAAATQGLWISASQAGYPKGLFDASGYVSPRIGAAWRPLGKDNLVFRGGYGIFSSTFYGNAAGSSVTGPPYWAAQSITFAKASNQRWETAFPSNPSDFNTPNVASSIVNIKPMKVDQFNASVQTLVPWVQSALTVSYVGSRGWDLTAQPRLNTAPPGNYTNLQAATPYPRFGTINIYESLGKDWYNGLQMKLERRFSKGLMYMVSYAFARDISEFGDNSTSQPTPYAPHNYDEGVSPNQRRNILTLSGIYELPYGRGRKFGSHLNPVLNGVLGGWQISALYQFTSGTPLTPVWTGATLGNGNNARPNIVGDPNLSNPTAADWFNLSAFTKPANYTFGNPAPGSA